MSDYGYGSWTLNHPVKATLLLALITTAFGLVGVGFAWLSADEHWLSPDNVLAGFGMGTGSAVIGLVIALLVLHKVDGD